MDRELSDYIDRTHSVFTHILEDNGCTVLDIEFLDVQGQPHTGKHLSTAHQMGTARMADSSETGVVDFDGQVYGHPGLYVAGGAAIPSSLAVNPSLTILANAERIADGLVRRNRLTG